MACLLKIQISCGVCEYPVNILWPIYWKFDYPVEFVNIWWLLWLSLEFILSDSKLSLNILQISCCPSIENSNILWSLWISCQYLVAYLLKIWLSCGVCEYQMTFLIIFRMHSKWFQAKSEYPVNIQPISCGLSIENSNILWSLWISCQYLVAYLLKIWLSCGVCEYLVTFMIVFRIHSKSFKAKSEYPANILWPIYWKFEYPVEFVNIWWPFWLSLECILSYSKLNLNILPISCGLSIENSNILWSLWISCQYPVAYLLKIWLSCGVCEYLVTFMIVFRMHSKWFQAKSEYPANILWPIFWKFEYPVEFVNIWWPFWLSLECILNDSKLSLNILPIFCGQSVENSNILWSLWISGGLFWLSLECILSDSKLNLNILWIFYQYPVAYLLKIQMSCWSTSFQCLVKIFPISSQYLSNIWPISGQYLANIISP